MSSAAANHAALYGIDYSTTEERILLAKALAKAEECVVSSFQADIQAVLHEIEEHLPAVATKNTVMELLIARMALMMQRRRPKAFNSFAFYAACRGRKE